MTLDLRDPDVFRKSANEVATIRRRPTEYTWRPYDLTFANFRLKTADLKPWDGRVTGTPQQTNAFYPVDERTLPPGVKSSEIITVAHVKGTKPIGGVSYRVSGR